MEVLLVLGCCVGGAVLFWTLAALGLKERSTPEKQQKNRSLPKGSDRD